MIAQQLCSVPAQRDGVLVYNTIGSFLTIPLPFGRYDVWSQPAQKLPHSKAGQYHIGAFTCPMESTWDAFPSSLEFSRVTRKLPAGCRLGGTPGTTPCGSVIVSIWQNDIQNYGHKSWMCHSEMCMWCTIDLCFSNSWIVLQPTMVLLQRELLKELENV